MIEEKVFEKIQDLEEKEYFECSFLGCEFIEKKFNHKKFFNCLFERCALTGVQLEKARLQQVVFKESKLMGIDFTLCDPTFLKLQFQKCLLRGCNFTEMNLKEISFEDCVVKECHFVQCNLEKANFRRANLEGTLFHKANLAKANFVEAIHYVINPLNNNLKEAHFSKPEVYSLLMDLGIIVED